MPFKLQGRSSTMVIQPCYNGNTLPITHEVAGDGLALLSIKGTHQDCRFTRELSSKQLTLSCARGIKPRNSFWNLHRPDLRKVKGLECTSSDRVEELFQIHNIENNNAKSYKKKVISKLGSIISKKSKTVTQPQVLVQNKSWPITYCVLSSVCKETEIVTSEILKNEKFEKTVYKHNFETTTSNTIVGEKAKDTVFITLPLTNMHGNTSDDCIPVNKLLDPRNSNGDSSTKTTLPFNSQNTNDRLGHTSVCETETSQQIVSSSILLESKQSQHQITIPPNVEFYKEGLMKDAGGVIAVTSYADMLSTTEKTQVEKKNINKHENFNSKNEETSIKDPSSIVVQSIFSDLFQDIQQIKDDINFYMSSFYVQEEEYNNFPALHISSDEVASHFFEQIHGSLKDKNCNPKNMHSTLSHFYNENAQSDCCPEQSRAEKVVVMKPQAADIKAKDSDLLQQGNNADKSETEKESPSSYCYWDDSDLIGEILKAKLLGKTEDVSVTEINGNSAVVPLEFIQNMWDEFKSQVETHALFMDLVNENEMKKFDCHEEQFPSYGHWANMYDPSIFQEAENIVHTLDSLLMNGCFPTAEDNNAAYTPCSVEELLDEREFSLIIEDELIKSGAKSNINRDENRCKEQEFKAPFENKANLITLKSKESFMLNESSGKRNNIDRIKIHEIKLEPIFYQEKVMIQDIECSRVPEYERVSLDPINQQGRVDFSTLRSTSDALKGTKGNELDMEEGTSRGHLSPKHVNEDNIPNKEFFSRNDSNSQLIAPRNDEKRILKNEVHDYNSNSGTSMFERIHDKNSVNSQGNVNPAFLFSSPTVHLDLTNPYVNTNKK